MSNGRRTRVLLMGAGFGTNNMGVGALAAGALRCLQAHSSDPSISFLDYGTTTSTQAINADGTVLEIPVVAMRFSKKLYLSNNIVVLLLLAILLRVLPSQKLRNLVSEKNVCLRNILEADIALALSGGDSFSDIYGLGRFTYVCLPQLLVLLLNKKLILLPQTLGPFTGVFPRAVARMIIRRANRVYSRDLQGVEHMRKLLAEAFDGDRYRFCYDLGFVLEPRNPKVISIAGLDQPYSRCENVVGLNVSGLLWSSNHNIFGFQQSYRGLVRAVIDHMIVNKHVTLLLVSHVFGDQPGSESDLLACKQVYEELGRRYPGRLGIVQSTLDQSEVKAVIGKCDFFIGSRMHACIASLSQHVPVVAVAYSDKFIGVLETVGVGCLVADFRKQNNDEIIAVIDAAYEDRFMISSRLGERIPRIKEAVLALCDGLPGLHDPLIKVEEPLLSGR
jgi:colanic acid/amylovoran biosynthesis protein